MKKITITAILLALCFATGFTCSKNSPPAVAVDSQQPATASDAAAAPVDQSQMAAAPTQPAATEAAPATETK